VSEFKYCFIQFRQPIVFELLVFSPAYRFQAAFSANLGERAHNGEHQITVAMPGFVRVNPVFWPNWTGGLD
jgi:hypothetical protein